MVEIIKKGAYTAELEGDWTQIPEWAIKRMNYLENCLVDAEKRLSPLMDKPCPADPGKLSCSANKHCFPGMCDGSCGKTHEIWVTQAELEALIRERVRKQERGEPVFS